MKIIISESQYNLLLETKSLKAAQLLIDMAVDDYVEICDKREAFQNIELALCKGFKNGTVKLEVTGVEEIENDRFEDNIFYVAHLILYVDKEWMLEDSYYEKLETTLAMKIENILGSFKYYCYIDEVKMNDSVIKENDLKNTLLNRIEQDGWEDTSELVGGYENLLSIVGKDKILGLLISCFSDLNVQKRGGDIFLLDWQLPILEKPSSFWGLPLKVFNDHIENRLEAKFGSDIIKPYRNVRREFIKELVSRFPDLYTSDVDVFKDSGLYVKYDSFSLG